MSGLEVCERIREKFPMCDLPVIMVSARGKPENIAEVNPLPLLLLSFVPFSSNFCLSNFE